MNDELLTSVMNIPGFLSLDEGKLLYTLACAVPKNGVIVEIGSYQGRSTAFLGLGAKEASAEVYAIDPHEDHWENESTHYGMENHASLLRNLLEYEVAEIVRVVTLESTAIAAIFPLNKRIVLLWIDGSHAYHDVISDLTAWAEYISSNGNIVVHDSSGYFPGVTQALEQFLAENPVWRIAKIVDATTVLERIHV